MSPKSLDSDSFQHVLMIFQPITILLEVDEGVSFLNKLDICISMGLASSNWC